MGISPPQSVGAFQQAREQIQQAPAASQAGPSQQSNAGALDQQRQQLVSQGQAGISGAGQGGIDVFA